MSIADSQILFDDGYHRCVRFSSLVKGEGVQANQFLIMHGKHAAVIDPGGDLTFTPLSLELTKYTDPQQLDYILASHQDPDIIASVPRWLVHTKATVAISTLWSRFLPHLASEFMSGRMHSEFKDRMIVIPDAGQIIPFGDTIIKAIPAHFLHSVGNIQFYDPISKILFSGDMGASMVDQADAPVGDFAAHIPAMEGFHKRYMCSHKVTRLWANMVKSMDVDMIVPQHGKHFVGQVMVNQFLDWIKDLECGVDLLTQNDFREPY